MGLHDVVVIPIVWRGRHDGDELIAAGEQVKKTLHQVGLDVWIDQRRHYTPGQKFAYWEHKKLQWRIEIGPKDLERGQICVCKHPETAGDFKNTKRKCVPLPTEGGARDLLETLQEFGCDKLDAVVVKKKKKSKKSAIEDDDGLEVI